MKHNVPTDGYHNYDPMIIMSSCFSLLFQNAYSYSQWYQQYGAAYGHVHQAATQ